MLPFPIVLLLIFSTTFLAPAPAVLFGLVRTLTLLSTSEWSTLPVAMPSPTLPSHSPETPSLPILLPQAPLDASPTCRGPSLMTMAWNNTIPPSHVYTTDDRPTSTAVLLVVALTMINCLVFRLLTDTTSGAQPHGAENESGQLMVFPEFSPGASPRQLYECNYAVNEMASPLLAVDATVSVSDSLERSVLTNALTHSSSYIVASSSPIPATPELSSPSLELRSLLFSLEDSRKMADDVLDRSSSTSSSITTRSIDPEVLGTIPIVSTALVDGLKLESLQTVLLDPQVIKDRASPLLGQSNISEWQELEHKSELQHSSVLSFAVEDAHERDTDTQDPSDRQSHGLESDGDDETFDYKGIDWAPETVAIPSTPATAEVEVTPSSNPLLEPRHDLSFGIAQLSSEKKSEWAFSPEPVIETGHISAKFAPGSAARHALDDIRVGNKDKGDNKTTSIARSMSADNLSSMVKTIHAVTVPDGHIMISPHDTFAVKKPVTLDADAPVLEPCSPGTDEAGTESQQSVAVGLEASIHAPNEERLETRECVDVFQSKHVTRRASAPATTFETTSDSWDSFIEIREFQSPTLAVEQPEWHNTTRSDSAESDSYTATSGIHASIHAPKQSDTEACHARSTEELKLTPPIIVSSSTENGEQRGLVGSIHATKRYLPNEATQYSPKHSPDAPNWAAAARAEKSTKIGGNSSPTRCGEVPEPALDKDEPEPSTTTRCAAVQDEDEGSVDNSDGSLGSTDDQEGAVRPSETEDGLDAGADSNEEGPMTPSRRTRGRPRPRRPRQKVPYLPPPRMRNLTQHPIVDILAAQAQTLNVQATPSTNPSGQYYSLTLPLMPPHNASAPGPIIPPSVTMHGQVGQHRHYNQPQHVHPPHPVSYSPNSFPQYLSSQMPFASQYGR